MTSACLPLHPAVAYLFLVRRSIDKIPHKFRDIPEAKRLRETQAQFEAAVEREKVLSKASGQQVYLVSPYLQRAQRELRKAQDAFDAATGLLEVGPLTKAALDEIPKLF